MKDRMAFFRQAAEAEKKAKAKQYQPKASPSPTPPVGPPQTMNGPNAPTPISGTKERVSLKKAPDPNKQ